MRVYTQDTKLAEHEFALPRHDLGLFVEIGGKCFHLTGEDGRLRVHTPDGRLVTYHEVANTFSVEIVER